MVGVLSAEALMRLDWRLAGLAVVATGVVEEEDNWRLWGFEGVVLVEWLAVVDALRRGIARQRRRYRVGTVVVICYTVTTASDSAA